MISVLVSPAEHAGHLGKRLEEIGARVVSWPDTSVSPPGNYSALDEAIGNLFGYDWLILKNANAARFFLRRFEELDHQPDALDRLQVCTIGEATAELLRDSQIHLDVEIGRSSANSVFTAIESYVGGRESLAGLNFLLPSANIARESFEQPLEDAGARVDSVIAYRTVSNPLALAQINALLVGGGIDCAFFSGPRETTEFEELFDTNDLSWVLRETPVVCRDEWTRTVAIDFGFAQAIAPEEPTIAALVNLIMTANAS